MHRALVPNLRQVDVMLLHLYRYRPLEGRKARFETTRLGIATTAGIPYPRVGEHARELTRLGYVSGSKTHVEHFDWRRMEVFQLTPAGFQAARDLIQTFGSEVISIVDEDGAEKSARVSEAILSPPSWLPFRLGELADRLSGPRLDASDLNQHRRTMSLRRRIVQALSGTSGADVGTLAGGLGEPLDQVAAALDGLQREGAVEVKGTRLHLESEAYARALSVTPTPLGEAPTESAGWRDRPRVPLDRSGLCLVSREWLAANRGFRLEDLRVGSIENGETVRIEVIHRTAGNRYLLTLRREGDVLECHAL